MNRVWMWIGCGIVLLAESAALAQSAPADTGAAVAIEGFTVEPGGLTVEETVRRAVSSSSNAGEKQAQLDAANARITQTTVQFLPKLGLSASYMRLSEVDNALGGGALVGAGTQGPLRTDAMGAVIDAAGDPVGARAFSFPTVNDQFALTANLTIPLSDYLLRLSDAANGAEASREAARLSLEAAQSKVRIDARVLYYNWLRAHAQVSLAGKAVERTKARLEDARSGVAVGKLSNADLMRVEALVANAELTQHQAASLRALIAAQLAIIMADAKGGTYTVGSGLPDLARPPEIDQKGVQLLLAEAGESRLELKAIDAALTAMTHGEGAARAGGYPRLDAVGELTYANPNQRYFPTTDAWNASWAAGLVASFNLDAPFFGDAQGDELEANARGLRAQRRGIMAMIVNEVVSAQLDVGKANAALVAGQISVRAAEESYRVSTDLFRVGRGTTRELIDAESELLGANLAMANARIDLTIAILRLQYALGREPKDYATRSGS